MRAKGFDPSGLSKAYQKWLGDCERAMGLTPEEASIQGLGSIAGMLIIGCGTLEEAHSVLDKVSEDLKAKGIWPRDCSINQLSDVDMYDH